MAYNPSIYINWTLIEKFELSDKALITYVAILKTYQLTQCQGLNVLNMLKNLFGPKAEKTKIIRQGLEELIEKEVISVSYQDKSSLFYDITPLAEYERLCFIIEDLSFFKKYEDLSSEVCGLYRLYLYIKTRVAQWERYKKGPIFKTFKSSLATTMKCSSQIIGRRLKNLEDHDLIIYEDYSDLPFLVRKKTETLFVTLPKFKGELLPVVESVIPAKYLKTV